MDSVKVCKHEIRIARNYFINSIPVNADVLKLMAIRVIDDIFGGKKKVIPLWYIKMSPYSGQKDSSKMGTRGVSGGIQVWLSSHM